MHGKRFVDAVDRMAVVGGFVSELCLLCWVIIETRSACCRLWWVEPSQQLSTHPVACSLFPEQKARGYQRRKLGSSGKNRLISRGKREKAPSDTQAVMPCVPQADQCPLGL